MQSKFRAESPLSVRASRARNRGYVYHLYSRMGSSVPSRSCPRRTPRGGWPASSCRVGADGVAVAGQLGEALSGFVSRHRSVVDLTADRPLKHRHVDERGLGMEMTRRVATRAVFDERALDALAGNVWQLAL